MSNTKPFTKTTELNSDHDHLEKKSVGELLAIINQEDQTVAQAVKKVLPQVQDLIEAVIASFNRGGRLFYIGAGTSGRLGIVDASECPPTFGVSRDMVIGIIAGGDGAIRKAVEFAEDNTEQGWMDLSSFNINSNDIVVGIAASGTTPYVIGALKKCQENKITTGCITCNMDSPLADVSDHAIEVVVGPEVITGSSRMKAGTAQKLILNMISTTAMIQMGYVEGNRMVDMQLSNDKLVERGIRMIMETKAVSSKRAKTYLKNHGSVRKAILKITEDDKKN